ncbi:MAG: outer-membrane lipoprotein carrier protein LolA [Myxococcota bacterium]
MMTTNPFAWLLLMVSEALGGPTSVEAPPVTSDSAELAPLPEVREVVALASPAAPVPDEAPPVRLASADERLTATVRALQKTYEDTREFEARFTQRYTYALLRRTQESHGVVRFKKPGLMRWDYTDPTPKTFLIDGSRLWVHQPKDNTVLVDHCFKQDGLTASVAFLWGAGDIEKQFHVSWFDGTFGAPSDLHLALEPREANGIFKRLILVVDPGTYRVKQSVVVDPNGNVNQFLYEDLRFNHGVSPSAFRFTPPTGTHTSRVPGSCAEPDAALSPRR